MKKDKNKTENNNITVSEKPTGFTVIMREIKKDKFAIISLIILGVLFLTIFIGAFLTNQEEIMKISLLDKYAAPGEGFYLGADSGGRDILGQLIIGARNSILPIAAFFGYSITGLLSGSIFIERIFSYPGMGNLFISSIGSRDYSVVTALILLFGFLTLMGSLLSDIILSIVDPRIRIE